MVLVVKGIRGWEKLKIVERESALRHSVILTVDQGRFWNLAFVEETLGEPIFVDWLYCYWKWWWKLRKCHQ